MTNIRMLRFKWFLLGVAGGPFLAIILILLTFRLWLPPLGYWLVITPHVGQADAIVVLAGGGPARMVHGINLYQQGLASKIWYTGDMPLPEMSGFTDGQLARDFAVRQGVSPEDICVLKTSSTWEDGQQIAAMAQQKGVRRIVIVTNWYHSRRALAVIRKHLKHTGVKVYYSPPPTSSHCPERWWQRDETLVAVINEWIKSGWYVLKYVVVPWQVRD